jgi:hypothetical protein
MRKGFFELLETALFSTIPDKQGTDSRLAIAAFERVSGCQNAAKSLPF